MLSRKGDTEASEEPIGRSTANDQENTASGTDVSSERNRSVTKVLFTYRELYDIYVLPRSLSAPDKDRCARLEPTFVSITRALCKYVVMCPNYFSSDC